MTKSILSLAAVALFSAFLAAPMAQAGNIKPVCSEDGCELGVDVGPVVLVEGDDD
jgi:hypothetical protein